MNKVLVDTRWPPKAPLRHMIRTAVTIGLCLSIAALAVWSPANDQGASNPIPLSIFTAINVNHAGRTIDNIQPFDGADWNDPLGAIMTRQAQIIYQFATPQTPNALWIHADHNDQFSVAISNNRKRWTVIGQIPAVDGPGQRPRSVVLQQTRPARYLRLQLVGGDGLSAVSELKLYRHPPKQWPVEPSAEPIPDLLPKWHLIFAALSIWVTLLLVDKRATRLTRWSFLLPLLLHLIMFFIRSRWLFPLMPQTISLVRMLLAATALFALLRMNSPYLPPFFNRLWPTPLPGAITNSVLGLCAAGALLAFANLGSPQFTNHQTGQPTYIHQVDMQIYFPLARYADELGFDGLYTATLAAMMENDPAITWETIENQVVRDLRDHELVRVRSLKSEIHRIKNRFSPDRWRQFKRDAGYFTDQMGIPFTFANLKDHGGNATPVWLATLRLLSLGKPASTPLLGAGALLDWLLILILFVATGRSFGWQVALVAMTVFGANDFYMGGTNWVGATLRHDWLILIGLALCALRTDRFMLGGGLLMWAALIRAFPGAGFIPVALLTALTIVLKIVTARKWVGVGALWQAYRPVWQMALGALAAAIVLIGISMMVYTPTLWALWLNKITSLNAASHVNNISLKAIFAATTNGSGAILARSGGDWQLLAAKRLEQVAPWLLVAQLIFSALLLRASWKRPIREQVILGLGLIPTWLDPANYYHHLVYAMVLLAKSDRQLRTPGGAGPAGAVLLLCIAQYATTFRRHLDDHYLDASVLLLATWAAVAIWVWKTGSEKKSEGDAK